MKTTTAILIIFAALLHHFFVRPVEGATVPTVEYLSSLSVDLYAPLRVTSDSNVRTYVTNPRKWQVQQFSVTGELESTITIANHSLLGVATDSDGNIYIGDGTSQNVSIYNASGVFIKKIGGGDGEVLMPNDIAIDTQSGFLYVSDSLRNEVRVYDTTGELAFSINTADTTPLKFPTGIAIDTVRSELLVGDNNFQIHIYDLQGTWKRSFGTYGASSGEFSTVQGIAVDTDSRIYVVDSLKATVSVFDFDGNYLTAIGSYGNNHGDLFTPMDAVIDKYNRLLVTSSNTSRVEIYGIDGGGFDYDGDNDGMADYWEDMNGLVVGVDDGNLDPDEDGLTNRDEYLNNTDPLNSDTDGDGVVSDGKDDSFPSQVTITVNGPNTIPIAAAGEDQTETVNTQISLDGSGSSDDDGDSLTYQWTQTKGTNVTLSDLRSVTPSFIPTVAGPYTFALQVKDSYGAASILDEVTVTVNTGANSVPIADAGDNQDVQVNTLVTLDGTRSYDPDGDPLTYSWDQHNRRKITLYNADTATPSFTPDKKGNYLFILTVNDGRVDSKPGRVKIHVIIEVTGW